MQQWAWCFLGFFLGGWRVSIWQVLSIYFDKLSNKLFIINYILYLYTYIYAYYIYFIEIVLTNYFMQIGVFWFSIFSFLIKWYTCCMPGLGWALWKGKHVAMAAWEDSFLQHCWGSEDQGNWNQMNSSFMAGSQVSPRQWVLLLQLCLVTTPNCLPLYLLWLQYNFLLLIC